MMSLSSQDKARFQTQKDKILQHLLEGQPVTEDAARRLFGVRRCAARISELRKAGYDVRTELVPLGETRVASWTLDPAAPFKEDGQLALPLEGGVR